MPDPNRHAGKSVLVTGSASGIGLGIVERFLAEGARVTGFDLNETKAKGVMSIRGDATDEAQVQQAVDRVVAEQGGLDVMVCNAGVIAVEPVVEMDYANWRRVMDINVNSVFLGSRAAARAMIAQGRGGVIVNASSGAGRRGVPNLSHYCASKAAILMLTQSLAIELAPHRIRANCYVPGHIETPFWGGIAEGFAKVTGQTPEEVVEGFRKTVPWGRFGTPDDVAASVSWLATPDAEYVSGQAIAMNGAEFPF
ncbi:SDR family oxidoreductase [Ponticoccus sp. SC2-23]|uniref:SDR family NAD(P)-dependent oxidoreductase n=1 Tax=Alexandriicola marinus TaxID=2081710 RepID=UPI0013E0AF95|nr:SDR family NAD(P)-dependent oxidoreductase [Alexandriicola marinus]MBM1221420.1 SDR family oxidoreductase [Ponticoccus sp. SC6-9]MBM1226461.1 SDR family oxidoreductase [Ponticoccus sp. SC6-15]MBM1230412.1 SDR family oxidoreductase [Ponticoccus sp. SC6-38]MBM1234935.1 SDR family oxidoreductase [Ponticoccus sp. SC6-45]MBM1239433.1 SDR family oxidoreductase [Ponticoccus sp. SC6-49]MBM1243215.1 SDR family oxidoreductase [Ponticoccus sp. SC2-64]MBM1248459.1 SDR family oxidoreductase [Ponticocc